MIILKIVVYVHNNFNNKYMYIEDLSIKYTYRYKIIHEYYITYYT